MRINFPNNNHVDKTTRALKKKLKKKIPKLSTQKLKNSICKSFGYQNYTDFQINNSPGKSPDINDVLLDNNLISELNNRFSNAIVELLVSDYGLKTDEAKDITDEALVRTQDERLTNASLDDIKHYIKVNNHIGYFGYDNWFFDADYGAKQLDEGSILIAAKKLAEKFESWDGKDIKSLIEPLDRIEILCNCKPENGLNSMDFLPLLPINHLKNELLINKFKVVEESELDDLIVAVDEKGGVLISNNEFPISNGHSFVSDIETMYQCVQDLKEY